MEHITTLLKKIEREQRVRVLYACETGSRAWGFPSPDSDYDIRFIYIHERDWYLSLNERKDTIEFMDGELDITGWDLKKSLTLLKRSNAPLIERFQSPVEYYAVDNFKESFKSLINSYYSPTAVFFHHHSLALKFWDDIKGAREFKLKGWFYLVRSLLSCNWIAQDTSVLPMDIESLMHYVDDKTRTGIGELIALKQTVGEKYRHPQQEAWDIWIIELFARLELVKNSLGVNNTNISLLNDFFLTMVNGKVDD